MQSDEHAHHWPNGRYIVANCPECAADRERGFVDTAPWRYAHVHDYLSYVREPLRVIAAGENSADARSWLRGFRKALDRRISMKVGLPPWRKMADGYLERLRMMHHVHDEAYLRRFAARNASALD